jgi:hypothetical protein
MKTTTIPHTPAIEEEIREEMRLARQDGATMTYGEAARIVLAGAR